MDYELVNEVFINYSFRQAIKNESFFFFAELFFKNLELRNIH